MIQVKRGLKVSSSSNQRLPK